MITFISQHCYYKPTLITVILCPFTNRLVTGCMTTIYYPIVFLCSIKLQDMKCNHCGWNNNGPDAYCIKCGNPLPVKGSSVINDPPGQPTVRSGQFAGTVVGKAAPPEPGSAPLAAPHSVETIIGAAAANAEAGDRTIDPYRQPTQAPKEFFLSRADGRDTPPVILPFSMTANSVDLNRASLDGDNITITSKVQAKVTFSDGKWHIIDCSEKKSTFIQVDEQHELKDGDILLIGNKRFVFSIHHPHFFNT